MTLTHTTANSVSESVSPSRRCCSCIQEKCSPLFYWNSHFWCRCRRYTNTPQIKCIKLKDRKLKTPSLSKGMSTYSKSPSENEGWRFSNGKRVTKAAPIFISTSATSPRLGTHTLNSWFPFFTVNQTENMWPHSNKNKEIIWKMFACVVKHWPIWQAAVQAMSQRACNIFFEISLSLWTDIICQKKDTFLFLFHFLFRPES